MEIIKFVLVLSKELPCSWLGIPIFGSNFWDPHWKRNFDSIFNSKDFSGIPIPFSIPKISVGIFFLNSTVEKSTNWNSNSKIWNSEKKLM
jgi:hypothetical protein